MVTDWPRSVPATGLAPPGSSLCPAYEALSPHRPSAPASPSTATVYFALDSGALLRAGKGDRRIPAAVVTPNVHAHHPDVPAAQRRERARIRGEKGIRRGGRPPTK